MSKQRYNAPDESIIKAKSELRSLNKYRQRVRSLESDIAVKAIIATSPRTSTLSFAPAHGGGNHSEDGIINYIDSTDEMKTRLSVAKAMVAVIEDTLATLTPDEREVLQAMYIEWKPSYLWDLTDKLNCGRTQIYKIKANALESYVLARGL